MYKQKVAEVKLLSDKCDELQEALTQAQGLQNTVRDLERQLEQQQVRDLPPSWFRSLPFLCSCV